jgi:hypothetical protein
MNVSNPQTENKRKQYLDQVGTALRSLYAIIHLVLEKYRDKLRETYSILVQIYSETWVTNQVDWLLKHNL